MIVMMMLLMMMAPAGEMLAEIHLMQEWGGQVPVCIEPTQKCYAKHLSSCPRGHFKAIQ